MLSYTSEKLIFHLHFFFFASLPFLLFPLSYSRAQEAIRRGNLFFLFFLFFFFFFCGICYFIFCFLYHFVYREKYPCTLIGVYAQHLTDNAYAIYMCRKVKRKTSSFPFLFVVFFCLSSSTMLKTKNERTSICTGSLCIAIYAYIYIYINKREECNIFFSSFVSEFSVGKVDLYEKN